MRMMNGVVAWYVLTLQRLFHFIECVLFLSISYFSTCTTCLGIEVGLWCVPRFLSGVSKVELLQPYSV